jgi:hypothetical protein
VEHAEAHEQLSDLALEPARLSRLRSDPSSEAVELRAHVASCDDCAADLAAWRRTWAELADAASAGNPASLGGYARLSDAGGPRVLPPSRIRDRILVAARTERPSRSIPERAADDAAVRPVEGAEVPSRGQTAGRARPWLATAAAVMVAVVAGASAWIRAGEVETLRVENTELARAAAAIDRVFAADRHWTATLRAADGTPGGTVAWSSDDVVVITTGLPAPGADQAYRCWLERDGARTGMGTMAFSLSTGYWAGSRQEYGGDLRPGGRFGVSLVPSSGDGTPVLVGDL